MNEKNKNQYHQTNKLIDREIDKILKGNYQQVTLGTIDENEFPYLSKVIPMYFESKIFLLISDLSHHTQNIIKNEKASIYFALEEKNKQKLNNPRLTLTGHIKKLNLVKKNKKFNTLLKNYIKIEKSSELWGKFDDFNFYNFRIIKYIYVKSFGKAYIK
tara:strand:+ start:291 stop:767 length:477 start_codon:yes stop_codon:yes gene_type:complete